MKMVENSILDTEIDTPILKIPVISLYGNLKLKMADWLSAIVDNCVEE